MALRSMFSVLALAMLWTQETQAGGASTGCGVAACLTAHKERYTFCIAMRFEWDSEKNRINQQKHCGIAFESAALVFDDPHVIFRKDRVVTGEQAVARHLQP